jgi:hypothetical protein
MENKKNRAENGKGDSPRNNFSKEYRRNFAAINWKKKEQKPKQDK